MAKGGWEGGYAKKKPNNKKKNNDEGHVIKLNIALNSDL